VCKIVTKKVHGKKKRVKVCHSVTTAKPTSTPTDTPTPTATATSTLIPTSTTTPTPTNTPTPTATPTQASIDPAEFGLALSDFPLGTSIQVSQIESNTAADADKLLLHFNTLSRDQEGRQTGYVMETSTKLTAPDGTSHTVLLADLTEVDTPAVTILLTYQPAPQFRVKSSSCCLYYLVTPPTGASGPLRYQSSCFYGGPGGGRDKNVLTWTRAFGNRVDACGSDWHLVAGWVNFPVTWIDYPSQCCLAQAAVAAES
jgi:hypothetical protein